MCMDYNGQTAGKKWMKGLWLWAGELTEGEMEADTKKGRVGRKTEKVRKRRRRAGGRRTKEEVSTCAGLQPLASHINTDTHAQHRTLLSSLNNASNRRDGAAAVATRERCGKAETEARGAARGLAGNQFCADVILPPFALSCPPIHPLTSHPSLACRHLSIQQTGERQKHKEGGYLPLLFTPFPSHTSDSAHSTFNFCLFTSSPCE